MEPNSRYPYNARSFFTNQEVKHIGGGIELWRGYFQSIRPGVGRMLLNIDISTGMMYRSGPLIGLALDFFGKNDPNILSPASGMPDRERLRLQRFLAGVRITTPHTNATRPPHARVVKKLSTKGANSISFTMSTTNQTLTVAQYFQNLFNRPLRYPGLLCVEVSAFFIIPRSFRKVISSQKLGSGALVPFELCVVPEGQIMKKQVPSDKTKEMVEFSTKKPHERFNSIREALGVSYQVSSMTPGVQSL